MDEQNLRYAQHRWELLHADATGDHAYVAGYGRSADSLRELWQRHGSDPLVRLSLIDNPATPADVIARIAGRDSGALFNPNCDARTAAQLVAANQVSAWDLSNKPHQLQHLGGDVLTAMHDRRLLIQAIAMGSDHHFPGGSAARRDIEDAIALHQHGGIPDYPITAPAETWLEQRDAQAMQNLPALTVRLLQGREDLSDSEWEAGMRVLLASPHVRAVDWFAVTPASWTARMRTVLDVALDRETAGPPADELLVALLGGSEPAQQRQTLEQLHASCKPIRPMLTSLIHKTVCGWHSSDIIAELVASCPNGDGLAEDTLSQPVRDLALCYEQPPAALSQLDRGQLDIVCELAGRWRGTLGALMDIACM